MLHCIALSCFIKAASGTRSKTLTFQFLCEIFVKGLTVPPTRQSEKKKKKKKRNLRETAVSDIFTSFHSSFAGLCL
jgi:hypothetical protein